MVDSKIHEKIQLKLNRYCLVHDSFESKEKLIFKQKLEKYYVLNDIANRLHLNTAHEISVHNRLSKTLPTSLNINIISLKVVFLQLMAFNSLSEDFIERLTQLSAAQCCCADQA